MITIRKCTGLFYKVRIQRESEQDRGAFYFGKMLVNNLCGGWPGGAAVKCTCSAQAAWSWWVRIPDGDMAPLGRPCCGRHPTYKVEEDGHGCQLRASLPQQKEEDWQQMLAQGQSYSKKKEKKEFVCSWASLETFLHKWRPHPIKLHIYFGWTFFCSLTFCISSSFHVLPDLEI